LGFLVCVFGPSVLVALLYQWLEAHLWLLALPFAAAVLWLSMGGTAHKLAVEAYINAGRADDWEKAVQAYQLFNPLEPSIAEGDWPALNKAVLAQAAYQEFAHVFAVLFWFALCGPAGALGYRLGCFYLRLKAWPLLEKSIWLLEWLPVRLLGLSFAFTGNFLSCLHQWRACVFCRVRSTAQIVTDFMLAALGVSERANQGLDITRRELSAMGRLFRRSLWFWVGVLALAALRGW
jgi:AmpE protein